MRLVLLFSLLTACLGAHASGPSGTRLAGLMVNGAEITAPEDIAVVMAALKNSTCRMQSRASLGVLTSGGRGSVSAIRVRNADVEYGRDLWRNRICQIRFSIAVAIQMTRNESAILEMGDCVSKSAVN